MLCVDGFGVTEFKTAVLLLMKFRFLKQNYGVYNPYASVVLMATPTSIPWIILFHLKNRTAYVKVSRLSGFPD
jgi:hypothetical protein